MSYNDSVAQMKGGAGLIDIFGNSPAGNVLQLGQMAASSPALGNVKDGLKKFVDLTVNNPLNDPVGFVRKNVTVKALAERTHALIPLEYSPSAKKFLQKYGDTYVTEVKIRRAPIAKGLDHAFELLSMGHWEEGKIAGGYDAMFHLTLIANGNLLFEKLSKIHLEDEVDKVPMSEYWPVPVPQPVKINEMLERTRISMTDEKYFKYDPFVNNCQQFVRRMLKVNGWLTQELEDWVVQPVDKILEKNPSYLADFSQLLTNTGALIGLGVSTRNGINLKGGRAIDPNDRKPHTGIDKTNPNVLRILARAVPPLPDLDDANPIRVPPAPTPVSPEPPPIPQLVRNNIAPSSLPSTPGGSPTGSGKRGGRGEPYNPGKPQKTDQGDEEEEEQFEPLPEEAVPEAAPEAPPEEASVDSSSSGTPDGREYLMDQGPDEDTQRSNFAAEIVGDFFENNERYATDEVLIAMMNYMRDVVDEEIDNINARDHFFHTIASAQYDREFNDAVAAQFRRLLREMRHRLRQRRPEANPG
jgi:hypothetical protein